MKRFRLNTLMLLIVIAALGVALVVQEIRSSRREVELQARLAQSWPLFLQKQLYETYFKRLTIFINDYNTRFEERLKEHKAWHREQADAEMEQLVEKLEQWQREQSAGWREAGILSSPK